VYRLNVPLNTLGHFGDDFYRSYDQTNSVKALKKRRGEGGERRGVVVV